LGDSIALEDFQLDEDGDGVLDSWALLHYGHTPLTSAELSADDDGDGTTNFREFQARTDPKNPLSVFLARLETANGKFTIIVPTVSGRYYPLQATTNLVDWDWAYPEDVTRTENTIRFINPGFFRVWDQRPQGIYFRVLVR
jgi:hypothetical protein